MEITRPNDIFVATVNNPHATTYDLMTLDLTPENTGLLSKDDYKKSKFAQENFKTKDGKFDDVAFDEAFKAASNHYAQMSNKEFLTSLNEVEYSPFDVTRPFNAKTFKVNVEYSKEFNPFQTSYSRTGINSITESPLSMRELAQQSKVFDPTTNTWSKQSANDLNLIDKLFGETLVYAQWDAEGTHKDPETGRIVKHKKGDWKVNDDGHFYIEKLAGREVYGKQVVNSMDMLTTDGSLANSFDFMDSDSREKSIGKTAFKLVASVAPYFIPGFGETYAMVRMYMGLASVLPTFYKMGESLFLGDNKTSLFDAATAAEGWLAKYTETSVTDEGSQSFFNIEQLGNMIADTFGQVHMQRAAASLSKNFVNAEKLIDPKTKELATKVNSEIMTDFLKSKISKSAADDLVKAAMKKIPELESVIERQGKLAKSLSLGYMALTSTADVYGEAINSGYDRRTAGIAGLFTAAGQYGIMMTNKMGDWFLDKATGYDKNVNKVLMRESIKPWLDDIQKVFDSGKNITEQKKALGGIFSKFKYGINDIMTTPRAIGEQMWKNALVEGVEEVTEQAVQDATEGVIDVLSSLGLTKKKGSFGIAEKLTSSKGVEDYLANFVGGFIGGSLFEFERTTLTPLLTNKAIDPGTKTSLYALIADGKADQVKKMIKGELKNPKYGNKFISTLNPDGTVSAANGKEVLSQADVIANKAIEMVDQLDAIFEHKNLKMSDDEIVKRAIMDEMIIKQLEQTKVDGSNIGLEGLILDDYKNNMSKVVDLEIEIKDLEKDEDKNSESIKAKQDEMKIYTDNINKILTGEKSMEYLDKILFHLNGDINQYFLTSDAKSYAQHTYKVDYTKLPDSGAGLTKERINKEWEEYVNSTNLKSKLQVALGTYKNIEQLLNSPIAEYASTGYDVVRKQTLDKILDLNQTVAQFNTATDESKKQQLLERFIAINNELTSLGLTKIAPQTVLQNDMFDQLSELNLIKRISYSTDENGKVKKELKDFTEEELNTIDAQTGISYRDWIKETVGEHFKKFPMDPLNAESASKIFNDIVEKNNSSIFSQIEKVDKLAPDAEEQVNKLKTGLIDVAIAPFTELPEIKNLYKTADDEIETSRVNNGNITDEQLLEYAIADSDKELYSKTFNEIVQDLVSKQTAPEGEAVEPPAKISSWKDLSKSQLRSLIDLLESSGLISDAKAKLSSSSNSAEVINEAINALSTEMSDEDYKNQIEPVLENLFGAVEGIIDSRRNLLENSGVDQFRRDKEIILKNLKSEVDAVKPQLFKLHNYAFELLIKALSEGSADKEVFLEAKKLYEEELNSFKVAAMPGLNNLSESDINFIIEHADELSDLSRDLKEIVGAADEFEEIEEVNGNTDMVLKDLIDDNSIFNDETIKKIFINNFSLDTKITDISPVFVNINTSIKNNKYALDRINEFRELESKGLTLKSNPLYDFIRKFTLSLTSDPNSKINKIFNILEREERALKAASSITNYVSDGIREKDINQAINTLKMFEAVIKAMSTTQVGYDNPVGFIAVRQEFAKRNKIEDDVTGLVTISSDLATLMLQDIQALEAKLQFVKDLAGYNSGKMINEQETIRAKMSEILLTEWSDAIKNINPSFLPIEEIRKILDSKDSNEKKLMNVENAVYEHNKNQKSEALIELLKTLSIVDSDDFSKIDKEVSRGQIKNWDLAVYYATILATKSEDFHIRSFTTLSGDFNKAPFYTQEFDARIIKASTVNPALFAKIYDIKKNSSKQDASYWTLVLGGAGTGKTSTVFGIALDNFRQTNETSNIWLSAPGQVQTDSLFNAVTSSVGNQGLNFSKFTKDELWRKLGIKELISQINLEIQDPENKNNKYVSLENQELKLNLPENWESVVDFGNLPNALLVDEVTHYSFAELIILSEISKLSYNRPTTNFMKLVGAGDQNQLGYLAQVKGKYYNYNVNTVNAIFTPRLWSTVRASNNQKRDNNDMMVGLVDAISKIYDKHNGDPNTENATNEAINFLKDVNTITSLSHYVSEKEDKINGDLVTSVNDKSIFKILKSIIDKDPSKVIGILTTTGTLDSELNQILTDVGIIGPDGTSDNIKIYTPDTIQGSESDYFIFSSDLVTKYDKVRDNLKAFYTYMSRAKNGTIILDDGKVLESAFGITGASSSSYSEEYQILTDEVVKMAKEKRKQSLSDLLGEDPKPSKDDNFKWKIGEGEPEDETITEIQVKYPTVQVDRDSESTKEVEKEVKNLNKKISLGNFKYMMHSFFNNPNAIINDGKISIHDGAPTDLNLKEDINDSEEGKLIIDSWAKLKNYLLHDLKLTQNGTISSREFKNYFRNIFTERSNFDNDQNINVELVLTAVPFDSKLNNPYKKEGLDTTKFVGDGQPFINLSAKLTFGGATHYITLATLGKKDTIVSEAINKFVTDEKEKAKLLSDLDRKFKQIESAIGENPKSIVELTQVKDNQIEFLTSTRLLKITGEGTKIAKQYSLTNLKDSFPGMKFSEVRIFPGDPRVFANLLKRYTFGEERSEESVDYLYNKLKNKPYIVVSYADDLDGSDTQQVHSKLIAVGSDYRNLEKLISEVNDLKNEVSGKFEKSIKEKVDGGLSESEARQKIDIPKDVNAKTDCLLNGGQVLDILIKWGTTPEGEGTLLDLLEKPMSLNFADEITKVEHSILDILNRFKDSTSLTTKNLMAVIDIVKQTIAAHQDLSGEDKIKAIKNDVIKNTKGISGWSWNFYNLFAYKRAIKNKSASDFFSLNVIGLANPETLLKSDGYSEMEGNVTKLMDSIKDMKFYYSLPIKYVNGKLIVNPYISGENGFSKEFFGHKFFINITPESERLLVNLNDFFGKDNLEITKAEPKPAETEEEKAQKFEAEKLKRSRKLLSDSSNLEEQVISGKTEFTEAEVKEVTNFIDQIDEYLSTYGTDKELEERKDILKGIVVLHNAMASVNDPISSFITDAEFDIEVDGVKTKISPFKPLKEITEILRRLNEIDLNMTPDQLQEMITRIQSLDEYSPSKAIQLFFSDQGLNLVIDKNSGKIKPLQLLNKFVKAENAEIAAEVKKLFSLCKDINNQLNKCK